MQPLWHQPITGSSKYIVTFVSLALADYLRLYEPAWPKHIVALTAIVLAAAIAHLNLRVSSRITAGLLFLELSALALLIVAGLTHSAHTVAEILKQPLRITAAGALAPVSFPVMLTAVFSGAVACSGANLSLYLAGDLRGPSSRVGAILLSTGIIAILLVSMPLLCVVIGSADIAVVLRSDIPVEAFLSESIGSGATLAVTGIVLAALLNNLVGSTIAFSRFFYSTGINDFWPKPVDAYLASLHPKSQAPSGAIALLVLSGSLLCMISQSTLLDLLATELFTSMIVIISVIVGRRRGLTGVTSLRVSFLPMFLALGFLSIFAFFWISYSMRPYTLLFWIIIMVIAYVSREDTRSTQNKTET